MWDACDEGCEWDGEDAEREEEEGGWVEAGHALLCFALLVLGVGGSLGMW